MRVSASGLQPCVCVCLAPSTDSTSLLLLTWLCKNFLKWIPFPLLCVSDALLRWLLHGEETARGEPTRRAQHQLRGRAGPGCRHHHHRERESRHPAASSGIWLPGSKHTQNTKKYWIKHQLFSIIVISLLFWHVICYLIKNVCFCVGDRCLVGGHRLWGGGSCGHPPQPQAEAIFQALHCCKSPLITAYKSSFKKKLTGWCNWSFPFYFFRNWCSGFRTQSTPPPWTWLQSSWPPTGTTTRSWLCCWNRTSRSPGPMLSDASARSATPKTRRTAYGTPGTGHLGNLEHRKCNTINAVGSPQLAALSSHWSKPED